MKIDIIESESTERINFVGVNFKENVSLSQRYTDYLKQSTETDTDRLMIADKDCVLVAAKTLSNSSSQKDPLDCLTALQLRNGFARSSGRMFAGHYVTRGEEEFLLQLQHTLPSQSKVRVHCYPSKYTKKLLDQLDQSQVLKENDVEITPTNPTHLLVAVSIQERIWWGVFTEEEYKGSIARPGDGDRDHVFSINFNKAQAKIAEALQLLDGEEERFVFDSQLLVVDVGAAPGGWSAYLANLPQVSVVAVDPAELDSELLLLSNLRHLKNKAEDVVTTSKKICSNQTIPTSVLSAIDTPATASDTPGEPNGNTADGIGAGQPEVARQWNGGGVSSEDQTNGNASPGVEDGYAGEEDEPSLLAQAGEQLVGPNWKDQYRLLVCDANLDVRDSVRELVLPLTKDLAPGALVVVTLKLGRRVGEAGVVRKVGAVRDLLTTGGFTDFRCDWLFANSKNERTVIARKPL